MKVLNIRFVSVNSQADDLIHFFDALGMPRLSKDLMAPGAEAFPGAIFTAGESWVEVWKEGPEMPAGIMLQIIVDDADAFAAHARSNGLDPQGPMDAHGEHIYFLEAPSGLQISFQSKLV